MYNQKNILFSFVEASKIIVSTLDTDKLLSLIMEYARKVSNADASSLLLLDENKKELTFYIALGDKGDKLKQIKLPEGEGIVWHSIKEDKPIIVNDVEKDPRWSSRADKTSQFKTKSLLCVPIKFKDKIIGAVEVINKSGGGKFTNDDQEILQAFASHAAVAIENARLFTDLRKEKEKIEALLTNMREGVLITDKDYKISFINNTCSLLLDLDKKTCCGINLEQALSYYDSTPLITDIINEQSKFHNIELSRRKGKKLILSSSLSKVFDENGNISSCIMVIRDITQERRESSASRNFLSLVSHKLRTPLVSILGYTPILLEEDESQNLTPFQKQSIQTILSQGKHLLELVEELLSFTTIEDISFKINKEAVKIVTIVEESLVSFKDTISKGNISINISDSVYSCTNILCDPKQIKEVFRQLIDNSIKFNTKPLKKIEISCNVSDDKFVIITIKDNGPGIPSEEKEKVFGKFYQIDDDFTGQVKGSGLGLTLAKRVIEAHGGKIWIESEIDNWTEIKFTLPKG